MANKGKKLNRKSSAEILQQQQLALAKTVMKANGYTYFKEGETPEEKKNKKGSDYRGIFKQIHHELRILEAVMGEKWVKANKPEVKSEEVKQFAADMVKEK